MMKRERENMIDNKTENATPGRKTWKQWEKRQVLPAALLCIGSFVDVSQIKINNLFLECIFTNV